jgi:hypothetical protein
MATSANPPLGAIAANGLDNDPFTSTPIIPPNGPTRYASFDNEQFSTYSTNSPTQARRALEAHLKDTDRRIQDASKLGTTLLQQRKNLASRLKEVEELSKDNDVPPELQQKLTALEKEYNDIGRESARAFLPKSKAVPGDGATVYSSSGRESPTKATAPSRRQRNQPSNRVHDIEFATEISTQLLAQVRQLQAALAEKDEELKDATVSKSQLEDDHMNLVQRAKLLDESLQRHRDDNWNLETKIQDLETSMRDHADQEHRLNQTLKATQTEKSTAQRDLDELKVLHEKATDEHTTTIRHHEADLHTLRRDAANHETEKSTLHKRIEELTSQNTELAKAVSYRWNQGTSSTQSGAAPGRDSDSPEDAEPENLDFVSPVKGTPARAGMLESETLKSSLNHAHRMIQNLKNNIHREKTEKVELKRMLAEARDEIEKRRDSTGGVTAANMSKKRSDAAKGRKLVKPERLGATRNSTTEIIEDEPDWEDHDQPSTPSRSLFSRPAAGAAAMPGAFQETDTSDAFETADERRGDTATETEAFQTGAESFGEDSDLTETEDGVANRPRTSTSRRSVTPSVPVRPGMAGDRFSYMSTASASGAEEDEDIVRTPVQAQGPKYRLRVSRGARNSSGPTMNERLAESPASSMGTPHPIGQSLGDELDGLDDDDDDSIEGTPDSKFSASPHVSPTTQRTMSVEPKSMRLMDVTDQTPVQSVELADDADQTQRTIGSPFSSPVKSRKSLLARESTPKPAMVDSGMMTEPWAPEKEIIVQRIPADADSDDNNTVAGVVAAAAGGTLAGVGLGRLSKHDDEEKRDQPATAEESSSDETPAGLLTPASKKVRKDPFASVEAALPSRADPVVLRQTAIVSQETEPIAIPAPVEKLKSVVPFHQSAISSQETEPVAIPAPITKRAPIIPFNQSNILSQETEPVLPPIEKPTPAGPFYQSTIFSQETEPVSPPRAAAKTSLPLDTSSAYVPFHQSTIFSQETEPVSALKTEPIAPVIPSLADTEVSEQTEPQQLGFSAVSNQDFAPVEASEEKYRPLVPRRSSRRLDALMAESSKADYDTTRASAPPGLFGTDAPTFLDDRSRSMATDDRTTLSAQEDNAAAPLEPKVYGGGKGTSAIPILTFGGDDHGSDEKLSSLPPTVPETLSPTRPIPRHLTEHERALSSDSMIPITKPLSVKRPMAESGSQTVVSGDDIERMIRDKTNVFAAAGVGAIAGAGAAGLAANSVRRSVDSGMSSTFQPRHTETSSLPTPRASASVGSMRSTTFADPPPLPADHNMRIAAAAAQKAPLSPGAGMSGTMGPPVIPASAYKYREARPKTPVGGPGSTALHRPVSKDSVTARPSGRSGSGVSRQASVSSFASELDERFNIQRGQFTYPVDMPPTTDPRMIQAITQTMIGEYLWKYTRKTGRNETSNSRHRRFFWVHPYTRTLYWSERDPSNSGKDMMKAKSMSIEAVRVITDDNTSPPGLHRKSIVVLTPGREIVFTAPTGQRHETWFNALSYLLLRTEQERNEADDTIDEEDIDEFAPPNPGSFSFRRSVSRMTGRSQARRSMSSYNSRSRPASPSKAQQEATTPQQSDLARPTLNSTPTLTPTSHDNYASGRGRFSSLTTKLRTGSQRGSFNSAARPGAQSSLSYRSGRTEDVNIEGSGIYNASVVSDSAEDLRAAIERQEGNSDRLENVRACCDGKCLGIPVQVRFPETSTNVNLLTGKHDVGSLNRKGRHSSFTRSSVRGHSHGPPAAHSHGHPRAEPMKESQRLRRGE